MDDSSNTDSTLGTGAGEQLHDGRVHPYPVGDSCYCGAAQYHSGEASLVAFGCFGIMNLKAT